jgi:hypothetical protein
VRLLAAGDAKLSVLSVHFLTSFVVFFLHCYDILICALRYVALLAAGDAKPEVREARLLTIPFVDTRAGTCACSLWVTPSFYALLTRLLTTCLLVSSLTHLRLGMCACRYVSLPPAGDTMF